MKRFEISIPVEKCLGDTTTFDCENSERLKEALFTLCDLGCACCATIDKVERKITIVFDDAECSEF